MNERQEVSEEDGLSLVYRDLLILLALVYMATAILVLPMVRIAQIEDSARSAGSPPGELVVELTWTADGEDSDSDLDLWVLSPDDDDPVSFRRKIGTSFALLRDDIGKSQTPSPGRFELSASTKKAPGEYVVSVFPYKLREPEVRAKVRLLKRAGTNTSSKTVVEREIVFSPGTGEVTAFRFTVDDHGEIVAESINHVQKRIVK